MSRASIQEATGVNIRSQQRYDRIASIRVASYANKEDTRGEVIPIIEVFSGKSRQWLIHKRLGNTYYCRAHRGHKGMLRMVRAAVRQSLIEGEACNLRRFFTTAKSYAKCLLRHDDPFIMVKPTRRLFTGRVEWCRINP